jgi:hypothetical protein
MSTYSVGYFVGSLASDSINRTLSNALIRLAPERLEFEETPIGNPPLYSRDYDADFPPEARALKDAIARSDAVLLVTPSTTARFPARSRTRSTGRAVRSGRTRSRGSRRRLAPHRGRSGRRSPSRAERPG